MKVLQIISGQGFSGAVKYAMETAQLLQARGHGVHIACIPDSWLAKRCAELEFPHSLSTLSRWSFVELSRFANYCRRESIDIVHTHNSRAHSFGVVLRRLYGIRTIATAHQRHFHLYWRFNDFVIANSEATLRYQRTYSLVPASRSCKLYCPVDIERIASVSSSERRAMRTAFGYSDEHFLIGCVGNIQPRKNQLLLVRAVPDILREVPNARIVFIGPPAENELEYAQLCRLEAEKLGVANFINWVGYESQMPIAMNAIDLCVCVPFEESFGLTAAEAMAARKPVVATAVGGLPETVIDGTTGVLIRPNDLKQLTRAIIDLLKNPLEIRRLAENGFQHVKQVFSVDHHLDVLESVYHRLAA